MASVWVRQVSTTSHGKRGWLRTPAAALVSPRTVPLVTQSSPRKAGILAFPISVHGITMTHDITPG